MQYWAIKFAANAAATVLRVDQVRDDRPRSSQIIMSKPAGGPKAPKQGAPDGDDE